MWRSTSATGQTLRASVAVAALAMAGCTGLVADRIVEAPNRRGAAVDSETVDAFREGLKGRQETLVTPDGTLALLHVPRRAFEVTLRTSLGEQLADGGFEGQFAWSFEATNEREPAPEPLGTVVVLHGFEMSKEVMGAFAALMADAGFEVVLVDLPGHGESDGDYLTYGIREAAAINALRRELELRSVPRPLIGFGVSLGGSVALRAAATELGWDAIVALQPFEDPAALIPNFRAMAPAWLRFLVSGRRLDKAVSIAEQRAGFDFDDARLAPLLAGYTVPTLIVHGREDSLVPVSQSEKLAAAAPGTVELVIDEDGDHFLTPLMLWRRCPNVMGWLGDQFNLPRPDAACERIVYEDPHGMWDAYREGQAKPLDDE